MSEEMFKSRLLWSFFFFFSCMSVCKDVPLVPFPIIFMEMSSGHRVFITIKCHVLVFYAIMKYIRAFWISLATISIFCLPIAVCKCDHLNLIPLSESVMQIKGSQDLSEAPCGTLLILPFRIDVVPHSRNVWFLFLPLILYLLPCLLLDSCELCLKQEPINQRLSEMQTVITYLLSLSTLLVPLQMGMMEKEQLFSSKFKFIVSVLILC